ncbi:Hypothetical predicted protein [Octopus vulgaris]|uniref:Uncharacterized protein n=1 Tax=Octopus vulgaris TaxID=6645 RepID=A0AA36EXM1_OCTVU|nr:Hypothetical predicted protein [Octopus vulgaris]
MEIEDGKIKAMKSLICEITSTQVPDNEDFVMVSAPILTEISGSVSEDDPLLVAGAEDEYKPMEFPAETFPYPSFSYQANIFMAATI